ncbi:uncharacterized protein LOC100900463 [Galendromus occidentalis]|uniref:Uncharacterized protein LOC100900463 n=1 Tax=Galendromus occidentalis TaxID=34638 RepID=A0AAJ6W071_9ACAR|nr:uncharacterized protein LOC100900463 [Galendromus occidentalis]
MHVQLCLIACVSVFGTNAASVRGRFRRDTSDQQAIQLPDGAQLVVGDIRSTFNCEGNRYGYYADMDNNCMIFHICNPVQQEGRESVLQYSFYCGNQTVFDQLSMTCAFPDDAIPCENSVDFFYLNDNLGIEDAPLHTSQDIEKKEAFVLAARAPRPTTEVTTTPWTTPRPQNVRAQTPPYGKRNQKPHYEASPSLSLDTRVKV